MTNQINSTVNNSINKPRGMSVGNPDFIKRIQQTLNNKLGLRLRVNGVLNFRTRRAIRIFQRRAGLPSDGLLNYQTVQKLLNPVKTPFPEIGLGFLQSKTDRGYSGTIFFDEAEVAGGGAVTPAPAASVCPRGLICLDHIHIPRQPDPNFPGRFITLPPAKLSPPNMNPGIYDTAGQMILDKSSSGLQTCLMKLVTTQFGNYLSGATKTPSGNDRLRVGLIDLTGAKLTQPDFAGWGSTVKMYGASVAKILGLYAAFQLRMDLRVMAQTQNITQGKDLYAFAIKTWKARGLYSGFPNLVRLFDIYKWSGASATLDFTAAMWKIFVGIMHNDEAGTIIINVGFPYIGSVAWQSGLFDKKNGGLWLTTSYGKGNWGSNPISGAFNSNVTAVSAATFFALLAQRRLVDENSSIEMESILRNGCFTGLFPLQNHVVASKCGIWSDYLHDCVYIKRGGLRYVVVGLTRTQKRDYSKYSQLFVELDKLIQRNNQTPKPGC